MGRVVNTFSDTIPILKPLQRAKIVQAFLGSPGVVKTVDVGEHSLAGPLSGLEMCPVYRLFFRVCKIKCVKPESQEI
jgi:hypothetical protein